VRREHLRSRRAPAHAHVGAVHEAPAEAVDLLARGDRKAALPSIPRQLIDQFAKGPFKLHDVPPNIRIPHKGDVQGEVIDGAVRAC
jgi:hypothetical protein